MCLSLCHLLVLLPQKEQITKSLLSFCGCYERHDFICRLELSEELLLGFGLWKPWFYVGSRRREHRFAGPDEIYRKQLYSHNGPCDFRNNQFGSDLSHLNCR